MHDDNILRNELLFCLGSYKYNIIYRMMSLHLFDEKYSKNSNIVRYYNNFK